MESKTKIENVTCHRNKSFIIRGNNQHCAICLVLYSVSKICFSLPWAVKTKMICEHRMSCEEQLDLKIYLTKSWTPVHCLDTFQYLFLHGTGTSAKFKKERDGTLLHYSLLLMLGRGGGVGNDLTQVCLRCTKINDWLESNIAFIISDILQASQFKPFVQA